MAIGTRSTYTDTNRNKVIVADAIKMIDWTEAPLLNLFRLDNNGKFSIREVCTKIEWMEDTMSPRSTTMNDSGGISSGDATVVVANNTAGYFKVGDIIKIEDELCYVSSVTDSTHTLGIVRAWGGTTAAAHADALTVELVTHASLEGSDAVTGHTTTITRPYNHTQIIREAVKVTGTEAENPKWDSADTMTYHLKKLLADGGKAGKLAILLERTFSNGGRAAGSDAASRGMGGFDTFATTNVNAKAGAALTRKDLEDMFQTCYEAGGSPETIICGGWARRKISGFYEKYITTTRSEERGGSSITTVQTDFGDMEVMYWRWCPANVLYVVEKAKVGWCTLRPFAVYDRASTGDYKIKGVLGEFTFVLQNGAAHGKISGFSTSK